MMKIALLLMLTLLLITLLTIVKFSYEIMRVKRGRQRVMHNRCYTDSLDVAQAHGNMEPQV
tara:strand:+ start:218 stop:400 length:183 start_codon:yes stop_codon:yes gene_type:complete